MTSGKSTLHGSCEGPLGIPLQSVLGPRSPSRAEATTSGFLSSADMDLGIPLEFPQESQVLSRVETCKSAFLSSCKSSVRLPIKLTWESVAFPRGFPTGLLHVPPRCESKLGVTVEAVQGNQVSLEWTETFGGLLEWWNDPWCSSLLSC